MRGEATRATGAAIEALVGFATGLSYRDLPSEVERFTRGIVLDTLGATIQASSPRYSAGRILAEFARIQGGTPESSIVGGGFQTSCVQAALVNGTLGYYCDVEPHHPGAIMHGAAIVVPTALAVGERQGASGQDFLTAVVVGIDVACRVASAIDPTALYRRGMHPSALAGAFGAAAAAARLLHLDPEQFRSSLGLVGTQASGLLAWETDPSEHARPFNPGMAGRNGTTAALLASLGFGGPPDIFEGPFNVLAAFGERQPDGQIGRVAELSRDLGKDFRIMGFAIKLYSCCAFLHPALDALLSILAQHPLDPEEVDKIDLRFPTNGTKLIDNNELKSHCAQYIVPIALTDRRVTIDDILRDRRTDPRIAALARRVRVVPDDKLDESFPTRYSTIVEVTTRGGQTYRERVDYARGCPENPISLSEIRAKFTDLTVPTIGSDRSERIAGLVGQLDRLDRLSDLGAALCEPPLT
jgi:2-methylcitrate dehydratase PrpD